jgi:hypothetical protein
MRRFSLLFFLLAFSFTKAGLIDAHGGGDLIARSVQAGPYIVSVWVNPPDSRALEPIHFTVGLASPSDGGPVLDAVVLVTMRELGGGEAVVTAPATTEQSINKLFYETDLEVAEAGDYEVEFQIAGADGEGMVSLLVEVKAPSGVNWLVIGLAGLGLVVVFGWWRSRRVQSEAVNE